MFEQGKSIKGKILDAKQNIKSANIQKKTEAIITLGILQAREAKHVIQTILAETDNETVKVACLYSLTLFGEKESAHQLSNFIAHENLHFRKLAYNSLTSVYPDLPKGNFENLQDAVNLKTKWQEWWTEYKSRLKWNEKDKVYVIQQ